MGSVYVHRRYEQLLGAAVACAKQSLPSDFEYHDWSAANIEGWGCVQSTRSLTIG